MGKLLDLIPGLGQIKMTATTVVYLVIGLAVAALIGFGFWEAHEVKLLNQQMGTLNQKNSDLDAANKNLSGQVLGLQQSGKVNDAVSNTDVIQKQDAAASSTAITATAATQVQQVIHKYQPKGTGQVLPASTAAAESNEISTIQLSSAWQSFCLAAPASTGCAEVVPAASTVTLKPSKAKAQVSPVASGG
jgi:cell division protein FtsB